MVEFALWMLAGAASALGFLMALKWSVGKFQAHRSPAHLLLGAALRIVSVLVLAAGAVFSGAIPAIAFISGFALAKFTGLFFTQYNIYPSRF